MTRKVAKTLWHHHLFSPKMNKCDKGKTLSADLRGIAEEWCSRSLTTYSIYKGGGMLGAVGGGGGVKEPGAPELPRKAAGIWESCIRKGASCSFNFSNNYELHG